MTPSIFHIERILTVLRESIQIKIKLTLSNISGLIKESIQATWKVAIWQLTNSIQSVLDMILVLTWYFFIIVVLIQLYCTSTNSLFQLLCEVMCYSWSMMMIVILFSINVKLWTVIVLGTFSWHVSAPKELAFYLVVKWFLMKLIMISHLLDLVIHQLTCNIYI